MLRWLWFVRTAAWDPCGSDILPMTLIKPRRWQARAVACQALSRHPCLSITWMQMPIKSNQYMDKFPYAFLSSGGSHNFPPSKSQCYVKIKSEAGNIAWTLIQNKNLSHGGVAYDLADRRRPLSLCQHCTKYTPHPGTQNQDTSLMYD